METTLHLLMAALTCVVEFAASIPGVKKYGDSKRAMIGAALGECAGLKLGIPGILVGPFVGTVIGELSLQRSLDEAGRENLCLMPVSVFPPQPSSVPLSTDQSYTVC
jgi:uncharacterized protein YqgC (DUF456 family)